MNWDEILRIIGRNKIKDSENMDPVVRCAKKFHRHARIEMPEIDGDAVVETGHQPNFLPHPGTFKKAFLASFLESVGGVISLFGIYDYNPATAKLLYQNRVPDISKNGFRKIGFKLSKKDTLKRFDQLEKPPKEEWRREIAKIEEIYDNVDWIAGEMEKSYRLGKNFADVNAILFARICHHLGFDNVLYFKYSDLQKNGVFLNEWLEISGDVSEYNQIYNAAVIKKRISDGKINDLTLAPFWYLCDCGGNAPVYHKTVFTAKCPVCKATHEFHSIEEVFARLSPRAVFRNLLFAKGLGTSLFISGSGGSLRYGQISNEMYAKFGIDRPLVVYWKSKDYYLSPIRRKVITEISKLYGNDFFEIDVMKKRLEWFHGLKSDRRFMGYYLYSHTLLQIAAKVFSLDYSMVDLLASAGIDEIVRKWKESLENASINLNEFCSVTSDVDFGCLSYHRRIMELVEESKVSDPANLLGDGR
ncbi:hypothetical protein [Archaeoglobus neptunius]|uniref:hypothetical protein n=1 Tax=Archaeoglobus neptunius TaxID=2798580 RepID=UPI0019263913|nr:hypothetical protein [Archaeoglobus neptunius]